MDFFFLAYYSFMVLPMLSISGLPLVVFKDQVFTLPSIAWADDSVYCVIKVIIHPIKGIFPV